MPKTPEQIRQQMQQLEEELKAAEKREEEKAERAIVRAAKRAGLTKAKLPAKQLEAEFRRIAGRAGQGDERAESGTAVGAVGPRYGA